MINKKYQNIYSQISNEDLKQTHNIMTMNSIFKKVNQFFVLAFENNNNDRIESSFV